MLITDLTDGVLELFAGVTILAVIIGARAIFGGFGALLRPIKRLLS